MSSSDDHSKKKAPIPSFSGDDVPLNVVTDIDDSIGEETTRRIAAVPFTPIFEPFEEASFSTARQKDAQKSVNSGIHSQSLNPPIESEAPQVPKPGSKPGSKPGWALENAPTLPHLHPLDRCAVFVPHARVSEVAGRISQVLQERSIEASYDNAKAKAKCKTPDNVEFRIRLYRGRNQYSHGIIVEVQRRFGASINFCQDSDAVLKAAQGIEVPPPPPLSSLRPEMPLVSDTEDDYDYESSSVSSLEFVNKMLRHPGYDAHSLALQTLVSLTDSARMGHRTARAVSKALVQSDTEVAAKVVAFATDPRDKQEEETFGLRLMAMTILSNAVQVVSGEVSTSLREEIRPALIRDLKEASKSPRMAFFAARCLEPIIVEDHYASELHTVLSNAQAVGQSRHADLCHQAKKCLAKIDAR